MIEPRDILVTGGHGRLGKALGAAGCTALGRDQLDITSMESLEAAIANFSPRAIINCAAYTAVDRAESEPELAYAINRDGAENVAAACAKQRTPLIHISTDCVFGDGQPDQPVTEHMPTAPLSIYGQTKLAGEEAVKAAGRQRVCITRVCWLFDNAVDTFIGKILNAAKGRDALNIVEDAYGRPTPVAGAARQLITLASRLADGMATPEILHLGPRHPASRYGWAKIIFAKSASLGKLAPNLKPCSSELFPEPARRPRGLVMETSIANALLGEMPDWRVATDEAVTAILSQTHETGPASQ